MSEFRKMVKFYLILTTKLFNSAFSSVFTTEPHVPLPAFPVAVTSPTPDITFPPDGTSTLIDNHKLSWSAGVDEIASKLLKNTKRISTMYLTLLYSQSLSPGTLPNEWKKSKVFPVYKSGNRNSPLNYRPISITSVPCKIMEHVLYSQVMNSNNFFHPSQHGFHKGLSCDTHIVTFLWPTLKSRY